MKLFKLLFLISIFYTCSNKPSQAQSTTIYTIKKGEVLDISLILEKEHINKDSLFDIYRKRLFPIAMDYSFQPIKGFEVKKTLQGGFQPNYMALGKWKSLKQRRDFIAVIVKKVPQFHAMRRGLWSSFDLTYYEMKEDLNFTVDQTKHQVATAYWIGKEEKQCNSFIDKWKTLCESHEGKIIVQLQEGESPSGYYYNPDYFLISEWSSPTAYERFIKKLKKIDPSCPLNLNEFHIEL